MLPVSFRNQTGRLGHVRKIMRLLCQHDQRHKTANSNSTTTSDSSHSNVNGKVAAAATVAAAIAVSASPTVAVTAAAAAPTVALSGLSVLASYKCHTVIAQYLSESGDSDDVIVSPGHADIQPAT